MPVVNRSYLYHRGRSCAHPRGSLDKLQLWFGPGQFFAPVALQVFSKSDADNFRIPIYTQWSQIGLMLIIYIFVPESPAWCVTRGKTEQAKKGLHQFHWEIKDYNIEQQYQLLVLAIDHEEVSKAQRNEKW